MFSATEFQMGALIGVTHLILAHELFIFSTSPDAAVLKGSLAALSVLSKGCSLGPVPQWCARRIYNTSYQYLPKSGIVRTNNCKMLNTFWEMFDTFSFFLLCRQAFLIFFVKIRNISKIDIYIDQKWNQVSIWNCQFMSLLLKLLILC